MIIETDTINPGTDADEVSTDDFFNDIKKPTEQDLRDEQKPPAAEPPPTGEKDKEGHGERSRTADDDSETGAMDDAAFSSWVTVEMADVGVSFACQAISKEWNPELFEANKANKKRLEKITAEIIKRYNLQLSPWIGLAGAAVVTFAGPVKTAIQIRKLKDKAKEAGSSSGSSSKFDDPNKIPPGPGRPTKEQQYVRDLEKKLDEARKKAAK